MAKILIIDDDDKFREMLRQMLERAGYAVVEATDGEKGLASFRKEPADLVITDVIMPNKEGVETMMEFFRDFPQVKIIAISGGGVYGSQSYLNLFKAMPNLKHAFQKPFAMAELLKAVQEVVG